MSIRALVVDDEAAARQRLRRLLAAFGEVEIVGEARDGVEAAAMISDLAPDLVFLDVQMPGLDGFEVLRALPPRRRWPLVIFTTAFDHYALRAFEAEAVAYLLKPVNRDKLARAVERAGRLLIDRQGAAQARSGLRLLAGARRGPLTYVVARLKDWRLPIRVEDAACLRLESGLVRVMTAERDLRTDYALAELEARLPDRFMRVHRGVIVNLDWVGEAVSKGGVLRLILKDHAGTQVQVSERLAKAVREALGL